jgi:ankyrin repeat protein
LLIAIIGPLANYSKDTKFSFYNESSDSEEQRIKLQCAKVLLDEGSCDIEYKNKNKHSAVLLAVSGYGNIELLQELLSQGASIHKKDKNDLTALMLAIQFGHTAAVKVLIQHGTDVNDKGSPKGTPLLYAMKLGQDIEMIVALLQSGAETGIQDPSGNTALTIAASGGHYRKYLSKLLDTYGMDSLIHMTNKHQCTLFLCAAIGKHHAIMRVLLERGSAINQQNLEGDTAIILTIRKNQTAMALFFLEQPGININLANTKGSTALHAACRQNDLNVYEKLTMLNVNMGAR